MFFGFGFFRRSVAQSDGVTVFAGSFASILLDTNAACLTLILHLDNNINTTFSTLRFICRGHFFRVSEIN